MQYMKKRQLMLHAILILGRYCDTLPLNSTIHFLEVLLSEWELYYKLSQCATEWGNVWHSVSPSSLCRPISHAVLDLLRSFHSNKNRGTNTKISGFANIHSLILKQVQQVKYGTISVTLAAIRRSPQIPQSLCVKGVKNPCRPRKSTRPNSRYADSSFKESQVGW